MNIKSIKTRQFAGVKHREITLSDGLNVLVGNNEAGKSTMIELMYQLLYRSVKLRKNVDKDFFTRFVPFEGAVVDGTLVFTTADGEYTLSKDWTGSRCELTDPKGNIIAGEDRIREIIAGELVYRQGLYDDVVFASQKRQTDVVRHILDELNKSAKTTQDKGAGAKQDFVSIISSEGMASAGGISPEDIEREIQEKMNELSGHWDFTLDGPEGRRGIHNPWKNGRGEILDAYYAYAELEDKLQGVERAEEAIDRDSEEIREVGTKLEEFQAALDRYDQYAEAIAAFASDKALREEYQEKKEKLKKDRETYREALQIYGDASNLLGLKKAREVKELYDRIAAAKKELEAARSAVEEKTAISGEDEKRLEELDEAIRQRNAKLSNLSLTAGIRKLGDATVEVRSIATGRLIDISAGEFSIEETVEITVPGVMSMTIAPKDVDVSAIQQELAQVTEERKAILAGNRVENLAELRSSRAEYEKAVISRESAQQKYDALMEGTDFPQLEADYASYKGRFPETEDLDKRIIALCGRDPVEAFAAMQKQKFTSIEEEYGKERTSDTIEVRIAEMEHNLAELDSRKEAATDIPEELRTLEDPARYREDLKEKIAETGRQMDEAKDSLRENEKELGDTVPEELRAEVENQKAEWQKRKEEYDRWSHILKAFRTARDSMAGDGAMKDVRGRFAEYLRVITDGRIVLQDMDEHMNVDIRSGDYKMNYEILSEGTKDTIALAFRLAMLEHLFPNGGALVVLDDPFTEMDENRTRQACSLVQKFADAGNQVIFVTCDHKYRGMLKGNVVEM